MIVTDQRAFEIFHFEFLRLLKDKAVNRDLIESDFKKHQQIMQFLFENPECSSLKQELGSEDHFRKTACKFIRGRFMLFIKKFLRANRTLFKT